MDRDGKFVLLVRWGRLRTQTWFGIAALPSHCARWIWEGVLYDFSISVSSLSYLVPFYSTADSTFVATMIICTTPASRLTSVFPATEKAGYLSLHSYSLSQQHHQFNSKLERLPRDSFSSNPFQARHVLTQKLSMMCIVLPLGTEQWRSIATMHALIQWLLTALPASRRRSP